MAIPIRPASETDNEQLRLIEKLAGAAFADIGMTDIAEAEPSSLDELARYAEAGRSWIALDDAGSSIGYVLADIVDGLAHVEQISVLPDHQGRGVGRALMDRDREWAAERRIAAI